MKLGIEPEDSRKALAVMLKEAIDNIIKEGQCYFLVNLIPSTIGQEK